MNSSLLKLLQEAKSLQTLTTSILLVRQYSRSRSSWPVMLSLASETAHSHRIIPDYIFMEINFPLLDGFYFLEQFQNLPAEMKAIKIVILSASIREEEVSKAKQYRQVVAYFRKPLTEKDLLTIE